MGREKHCKEISLMCVGSARSVWATLGLPLLTACVLSQSTLLRLQVALQGNCPKQALGCMHLPGLSHSGSGFRVLHKGTDSVGPAFCALPGPSSSGDQVLGECTLPRWWWWWWWWCGLHLISFSVPAARFPGCAAGAPCQVCHMSPLGS